MYIEIHELPLFKPNINISNRYLRFIIDDYENYIFDGHIEESGQDFKYDRPFNPYLIIERFDNVVLHHHLVQEPTKKKLFAPLRWIGTEWFMDNKLSNICNIKNIEKMRGESDLEHCYISTFNLIYDLYLSSDSLYRTVGNDPDKISFIAQSGDMFNLAGVQIEDLKHIFPSERNLNYSIQKNLDLLDNIYCNFDYNRDEMCVMNSAVINNAFKSIQDYPLISTIFKYLNMRDAGTEILTGTDLNNILNLFPNKRVIKDKCSDTSNNITKEDLITEHDTIINVSNLNNEINTINSIHFSMQFVKDKNEDKFILSSTCEEIKNIDESTKSVGIVDSSNISKYITDIARVFKFYINIETITLTKENGIVNIEFKLKDGQTKNLTFNLVSSIISTTALCAE